MHGMTTSRHYSRAPIAEAIIDFQVELPEGVDLSDLERCQDAAYPGRKALTGTNDRVGFRTEGSTSTTLRQVGFLFASVDEKQLFEARCDGFTVHRLAPYQGWESFRDEARRLWDIYAQTAHPSKVARVALRYINRLDLPLPVVELKDYLRTCPEVSPDLPRELEGFFLQLNIPQPDIKTSLLLRETVVPPAAPGVASVVLDIDLFRSHDIPPDDAGMWAFLESLRARKNKIFEACITDRTRQVIQ
jgi:uncharacterized protein (TIGR04255 family)